MSPYRAALFAGLLYGLPLGAWVLGGLAPDPLGQDLRMVATTLPLVQLTALMLLLPAFSAAVLTTRVAATALLLMLPWPLLPVLWATGVPASSLIIDQGLAMMAGLVVTLAHWIATRSALHLDHNAIGGAVRLAALLGLWLAAPALFGPSR